MTSTVQEIKKFREATLDTSSYQDKSIISISSLKQLSDKCLPLKKRSFVANFWIQLQIMQKNDEWIDLTTSPTRPIDLSSKATENIKRTTISSMDADCFCSEHQNQSFEVETRF